MQVLPTFFTEIFVWTCVFVHDADAATMLPHLAGVALQKEAGQIFRDFSKWQYGFLDPIPYAILVVFVELWRTWVVVETADAPNGLVVLSNLVCAVGHVDLNWLCFRGLVLFVGAAALSTCLNGVLDESRNGVVKGFGG